jgi:hypothetical protein
MPSIAWSNIHVSSSQLCASTVQCSAVQWGEIRRRWRGDRQTERVRDRERDRQREGGRNAGEKMRGKSEYSYLSIKHQSSGMTNRAYLAISVSTNRRACACVCYCMCVCYCACVLPSITMAVLDLDSKYCSTRSSTVPLSNPSFSLPSVSSFLNVE